MILRVPCRSCALLSISSNAANFAAIDLETPSPNDPTKLNDANVLAKYGCGKLGDILTFPAKVHVGQVHPNKALKKDGKVQILWNNVVSDETKKRCLISKCECSRT